MIWVSFLYFFQYKKLSDTQGSEEDLSQILKIIIEKVKENAEIILLKYQGGGGGWGNAKVLISPFIKRSK